jgi:hypothetical protein
MISMPEFLRYREARIWFPIRYSGFLPDNIERKDPVALPLS